MKNMMGYLQIVVLVCTTFMTGLKSDDSLRLLSDDVLGLIVFKTNLHDPLSHLDSWNQDDASPCSWSYVKCDPVTGRVSSLLLESLGLSGKIGRGIEKLQHLKVLSLSGNNISGTINPELGLMTSLERLNLGRNSLSGRLDPDSLAKMMSSIKFLDLSENSLSGPLPDLLFENCSSLRSLSVAENSFEGPIPATLAKCTSLNNLNLSSNQFSGNPEFVSGFWKLNRLRTLDLSRNVLTGPVPNGVAGIHYLKELKMQSNKFSGLVPSDMGLCPHLIKLDLSDNVFTGALPESLQRLKSLTHLSVSKNMFSGDLPQWIGKMSSLEYVDFSSNSFMGLLPSSMGDLSSLTYLSLADNFLNGSIPEGLFALGLSQVDLSRNELSDSIPSGSSRLFESLEMMDLSGNKLTGNIPAEMGLYSKLRYLNLSHNNLQSTIPPELGYIQNLTVLDLRCSALLGSVPGEICDSGNLGIMQLDGNSLTGPLPDQMGNCSSLYLLSLSHNNLSSSIPRSISMLKRLKILKLEFNQFSGEIPQELGMMENLLSVNISYNSLIGRLPVRGIFPTLNPSAFIGNLGICSPLLKGPCKLNVSKPLVLDPFSYGKQHGGESMGTGPMGPKEYPRHRFLSVSAIISISAAILIAVGVLVISVLNVSARRRLAFIDNSLESLCSSSTRSGMTLSPGKLIWFNSKTSPDWNISTEMLFNKATEIGGGIFGTVYKASLGNDGRDVVAIKKLETSNIIQNQEDFDREVRILGKARHPNLITLKGYYWTPQLKLLVTEYESNGSLQAKLRERSPSATTPLSWSIRLKIIVGTAKGLAHLHHSFRPPIIHYNIKPSNILLDDNFNPKLSDFGLTRLLKKLEKHVASNRFQSALGYVAPELACQSLRVNEKCDIYGFGVLILELVTGRRPVEYGEDDVVILHDHVRILLEQGNVLDCVDPDMGDYPEDEVSPVLKLALVCTSHVPSDRPSMSDVVQILQVIKAPVPSRTEAF